MPNILEKILFLIPNAQCSVWHDATQPYGGEGSPIALDEGLVDWHSINTQPCPTQAQLNAVNASAAIAQYAATTQSLYTAALMQNPVIASNYQTAAQALPTLTPAAYISGLQSISSTVSSSGVNIVAATKTSLQTS